MRLSRLFLPTLRELPADAEIASHRLMLRSGMIRKVAAGIYTWLPLGLRVLQKVERIVREEMDSAGAQEVSMPAIQPAELWQESGRWAQYGPELLRLHDRHERAFCFGPTHEEVITDLVRRELRSYKQLPAHFYQIQTKFRDEVRPRFGVMRAREFLMKDAYSFHLDQGSLEETYARMHAAYTRIFRRIGLDFRAVVADSGNIGGAVSHEFHVLADSGEDAIAYCPDSDYAANLEMAEAPAPMDQAPAATRQMRKVETPGRKTVAEVGEFLGLPPEKILKTIAVIRRDDGSEHFCLLCLRGDHELNEVKARRNIGHFRFASDEEIEHNLHCRAGYIGPVQGLPPGPIGLAADRAVTTMSDFVCGANEDGVHLTGVNWGRDLPLPPHVHDLRNVVEGDASPDGRGRLVIARGIEVGHIFQLGDKYSRALGASCLDEHGKAVTLLMGCYGIGVSRVVAAAIEQHHDERGILWPPAVAPFEVALAPINLNRSLRLQDAVRDIAAKLEAAGIDVLVDDRGERAGVMFADLDLIGIPHRLVLSDRGLDQGTIEYKMRHEAEARHVPIDQVVALFRPA